MFLTLQIRLINEADTQYFTIPVSQSIERKHNIFSVFSSYNKTGTSPGTSISRHRVQRCLSRPVVNVADVRPAECFFGHDLHFMLTINVRAMTGEIDTSLTNQTLKISPGQLYRLLAMISKLLSIPLKGTVQHQQYHFVNLFIYRFFHSQQKCHGRLESLLLKEFSHKVFSINCSTFDYNLTVRKMLQQISSD